MEPGYDYRTEFVQFWNVLLRNRFLSNSGLSDDQLLLSLRMHIARAAYKAAPGYFYNFNISIRSSMRIIIEEYGVNIGASPMVGMVHARLFIDYYTRALYQLGAVDS